ncbi:MAG: VOC family protein [Acidimicrobiales bacterium]
MTSHWTLLVTDLDRSSGFYAEVMGWRAVRDGRSDRSARFVRDGQRIELATAPAIAPSNIRPAVNHVGLSHITVATDPAPLVVEALQARRVAVRPHTLDRFVPDPSDPAPTQFLFEDPDGNVIETFAAVGDSWNPFGSVGDSDPEPSLCGVRHLSHWSLCISDPGRSLPFYREVLGWEDLGAMKWEGEGPSRVMDVGPAEFTTWLLAAGDQRVEIIHFDRPAVERRSGAGTEAPGLARLNVEVDDVRAAAERLAETGAPATLDEVEGTGTVLVTRDPDGVEIRCAAQPLDWTSA